MIITEEFLLENKDEEDVSVEVTVPWDETNLSGVYKWLDASLPEKYKGGIAIDSYGVKSFNKENNTFKLWVKIDLQDLEEEMLGDEHEDEGEV